MNIRRGVLCLAAAVAITGCKTDNESIGAVIGGIGGAAATYGITSALGGDSTVSAIAAAGGGVLGAYLGSEIGRRLDEADREKAAAASAKAVTNGQTGQTVAWKSDKNPNVYGQTRVVDTGKISNGKNAEPTVTWQRSRTREPIKVDTAAASPKSSATATPTAPRKKQTAPAPAPTPEAAKPPKAEPATKQPAPAQPEPVQTASVEPADQKSCKKIDEVAYINGKETRQQRVFCQTASGGWAPVNA